MSVVDQRVWGEAGRARRLLARVLLVLGGSVVATVVGWLLCSASASADVLPTVPVAPTTMLSSVVPAVSDVVTVPALPTATLPATTLPAALPTATLSTATLPTALPAAALPTDALPKAALPGAPGDLGQVTQQVHALVSDVDGRGTPVSIPAPAAPAAPAVGDAVATPVGQGTSTSVGTRTVTAARPHAPTDDVDQRVADQHDTSTPAGAGHRLPVLPPSQPSGSSDTGAHGSGGSAGGSGAVRIPHVDVLRPAPNAVGLPTAPRLPVAPGQQPGTSPD